MARTMIAPMMGLTPRRWTRRSTGVGSRAPAREARRWAQVLVILPGLFLLAGSGFTVEAGGAKPQEYQTQNWQVEDGLPQGNVRAIAQLPSGLLLIATGSGIVTFDGLRFEPMRVDDSDAAVNEPVNAILLARNGDLWFGTDDRGVIRRRHGQNVNVSESAGLRQERVRKFFEDDRGVIWTATQNGVERIVGEKVECLGALGVVAGDVNSPFASDGAGGVLIVTARGLFHWREGDGARPVPLGLSADSAVTAVYRDRRATIWIGTQRGVFRLDLKAGKIQSAPESGGPRSGGCHPVRPYWQTVAWHAAQRPVAPLGYGHAVLEQRHWLA